MIFYQCHSAEKCSRGTIWDFLSSILLQIIETIFGASQNFRKMSHSAEKIKSEKHQDSQKGDPYYVSFVLDEVSSVFNLRSSSC